MPDCIRECIDAAIKLVPVILLSVLGGVVSQLQRKKEEFSWWWLLVGIITAAFVGLIVHFLLQTTAFPDGLKSAVIAISGYASRDVLILLKEKFLNRLKKEIL